MLFADFSKTLGAFELNVSLAAEPGATLVLVGESGAGKTTVLNLLAGLARPDRGEIRVDADAYFDSRAGLDLPAHRRSVGYVFQDYALFPHLSVFENAAFGLRAQGRPDRELRPRVGALLEQLGVAELAHRRVADLSGGQRQRVALARALVLEPRLLLLDEPLAALDLQTRRQVRAELRRVLAGLAGVTVFVTHSPFEALVFADRAAVLERGRVVQTGSRDELLRQPRSRYVGELMGLNFFRGRVTARDADGLATVETPEGSLRVIGAEPGDEVFVAVDPREITLHTAPTASPADGGASSAQNVFTGAILELVPEPPLGERVRVVLDTHPRLVAEITAHARHSLSLQEGLTVSASFKATAARVYS